MRVYRPAALVTPPLPTGTPLTSTCTLTVGEGVSPVRTWPAIEAGSPLTRAFMLLWVVSAATWMGLADASELTPGYQTVVKPGAPKATL